jgi:sulfonate transport system permease protein
MRALPVTRSAARTAIAILAMLVAWEAVGRFTSLGHAAVPAPSQILAQYWSDRDLYPIHMWATLKAACLGFLIGNTIAIVAAIAFCRFPALELVLRGVNITLFAIPPIVVGPILVLLFQDNLPQIILAAMAVYFSTMAATLIGLREIDPRLPDVIRAYGGGESAILRFVRLRSAVPSMLAGLRVAAATSVLGAILAEFGSGARWGLGSFLLGSLGQGNAPRLWGIALSATAMALVGYGGLGMLASRLDGASVAVTVAANQVPDQIAAAGRYRAAQRVLLIVAAIMAPFVLWWLAVRLPNLSPIIAPGPIDTFHYLFTEPGSAETRAALLAALAQTLPVAGLGLIWGMAAAFILACLSVLAPRIVRVLLPPALVLQTTPLVALVPIVLLIFGRDTAAALAMTVAVVFFPAFVMLSQGFALVPRAARDVVRAYGASGWTELTLIAIPYAMPYLFAAAKLVAPRALLGVMISEWLLSGTGLGNLLNVSRGTLEYGMVWAGACISVLIAIAAYQAVSIIERLMR